MLSGSDLWVIVALVKATFLGLFESLKGLTYYQTAVDCRVRGHESFGVQGQYLVAIGQNDYVIVSSGEGPKVWLGGMLDVQVLQVDGLLGRKGMENALEQGPMLVAMYPMLIYTRLHFFEFKPRKRVKGEPKPVCPLHH